MDLNLAGKNALVCGASRGIGAAAAAELALLGANVTVAARSEDKLKALIQSLDSSKGQTHDFMVADFSDTDGLKKNVDAQLQSKAFHILVNNTGGPPAGPAHTADLAAYEAAFTQHLLANHVLVQALLSGMREAGYGRIINVISTSVKAPLKGLGVSNTIRGAVANWAKTLSMEVAGDGITVNNVLPGATDTDRLDEIIANKANKQGKSEDEIIAAEKAHIPAGRFGKPEELGAAIAFLASPAAAYINGINLPVDGGRTGNL